VLPLVLALVDHFVVPLRFDDVLRQRRRLLL
jgi:hypothetical protein